MDKNTTLIGDLKKQAGTLLANHQLTEAKAIYERLCELAPDDADNRVKLGGIHCRLRNFVEAEQCARQALVLQPDYPSAHHAMGAALQQQGRLEEALTYYRKAVSLDPNFVEARYFLANALREGGYLDEAATAYHQVLKLNPDHFECLNNLGILLTNLGDNKAAVTHLQHANQLQPDNTITLTNLGDACVAVNQYDEAIRYLRHALHINPGLANVYRALANALHHAGKMQDALAGYRKLAELQPGSTDAVLGQAKILEQLGKYQESYALLQPLLKAGNKDAIPTFFDISTHVGRRDEAVAGLEGMLAKQSLRNDYATACHFKLGKHYDEIGDYNQAFPHFQQANALTHKQFDKKKLARFVNDSVSIYSQEFVQHMPRAGNRSELPVFIVGMPRSGTSLVEQILASHPDVFGAGELQHISRIAQQLATEQPGQPVPLLFRNLTQASLNAATEDHLQTLQNLGGNATRVTDKMPGNFRYVGLIVQLFPESRVIHCVRHPLDICLSCFFANFGITAHNYIHDLQSIGEYYLQYHRMMQHWETVFPNQILRISYEQLVQQQEETSRILVGFCGLEWDDRCLEFHTSDRFVFTLSYDQVRQPLYTRSLHRWKHYEKHLGPLRDLLESGGIDCG